MNKNKLARQHGFFSWEELLREAKQARKLREELRQVRQQQAPLEHAVSEVAGERVLVSAERAALASAYRDVARLYRERGASEERASQAAKVLAGYYEGHAEELETGKTRAELIRQEAQEIREAGGIPVERFGDR
jgi:chromosome segregation ATPase